MTGVITISVHVRDISSLSREKTMFLQKLRKKKNSFEMMSFSDDPVGFLNALFSLTCDDVQRK